MKFINCIVNRAVMVGLACLLFVTAANAQREQAPTNAKGLLQRLIEIKYSSELYLSNRIKKEEQKDSAMAIYNTLRWKVDGFVYQISSEMIAANSPRQIRKLNEWCVGGKSQTDQQENLQDIEMFYETYIQPTVMQESRNINLSTNVFYLIKDSYSVVKGLSDLKTQKTMALVELLDHTRLMSPGELVKGVK